MTEENQANKEQAVRALEEALSGTSAKSKNSLIKEALAALRRIK
jgi:hypothetical protein